MLLMPAVTNRGCTLGFALEASLRGLLTRCCWGTPLLVVLMLVLLVLLGLLSI